MVDPLQSKGPCSAWVLRGILDRVFENHTEITPSLREEVVVAVFNFIHDANLLLSDINTRSLATRGTGEPHD